MAEPTVPLRVEFYCEDPAIPGGPMIYAADMSHEPQHGDNMHFPYDPRTYKVIDRDWHFNPDDPGLYQMHVTMLNLGPEPTPTPAELEQAATQLESAP